MPGRAQAILILPPQQKIQRDFLASWISCVSLGCPVHICNSSQPGLSAHGSLKSQGWQHLLAKILPFSSNTNTALCTAYLPGNLEGMKAISYLTAHFSVGGQCVLMCNSLCSRVRKLKIPKDETLTWGIWLVNYRKMPNGGKVLFSWFFCLFSFAFLPRSYCISCNSQDTHLKIKKKGEKWISIQVRAIIFNSPFLCPS